MTTANPLDNAVSYISLVLENDALVEMKIIMTATKSHIRNLRIYECT